MTTPMDAQSRRNSWKRMGALHDLFSTVDQLGMIPPTLMALLADALKQFIVNAYRQVLDRERCSLSCCAA